MKHFKILDFPKGLKCHVATSSALLEEGGSTDGGQEGGRRTPQIHHRGSDLHLGGLGCFFPQTISMAGDVFPAPNLTCMGWVGAGQ